MKERKALRAKEISGEDRAEGVFVVPG